MKQRTLALSSLALAATLLLSACGSSGDTQAEPGGGATIATKFGEVEAPKDPQRVVALGWGDAENALALGVQPVGASDWLAFGGEGVGPWAKGMYDTAPEIIETLEPSYEKIAALKPDLILDVKSSGDQERYDKLSAIAPTVGVPEGGDNYLTSLDQQISMTAQALGKEDEGKKLAADIDEQFATAKDANPAFEGKTATVAAYTAEGWGAYIKGSERVTFMENLGFQQNPKVEELEPEGFSAPVSNENLDILNSDALVVFPIYVPETEITDQAAYKNLTVVKDKKTLLFGDKDTAVSNSFSLNSALSVQYAIKEVPPRLAEFVR